MPARWKKDKEEQLTELVISGKYTYGEISEIMGMNKNQITTKTQSLGLKNPVYLKRITKHSHIREAAMTYFLTHTFEQTMNKFSLTRSELKSLMTVSYRDPKLSHLRKDNRRKDCWSLDEKIFMIQHSGIQPRSWIANKLGRGTMHSVKESLRRMCSGSKWVNGMPKTWAIELFGPWDIPDYIETKAGLSGKGSHGQKGAFYYRIVPWVLCDQLLKKYKGAIEPDVATMIRSMAKFQRWIHRSKSDKALVKRLSKVANEGEL